jgi:transcriptional regulator GlxA family with amidase domain
MHRVGFLVPPGFQVTSFAAVTVFELANRQAPQPIYELHLLSEAGGLTPSSLGMRVETEPFAQAGAFDTLIVGGGLGVDRTAPGMIAYLQAAMPKTRRMAAICTGAFTLAEAGILDGRRATTHWAYAQTLKTDYPQVRLEEDRIFVVDGSVWTSAGMSAGVDLALAMVEKDLGAEASRRIARAMVVYHRRAGGQSQFSTMLDLEPKSDRIQDALSYARRNLKAPLSVDELAEAAHLSPRQFSRAFHAETGQSPAKAVEHLRVEAARLMMEEGRHSLDVVARETGFDDRERMRRAFLRVLGQPPQAIRRNARQALEPI